MQEKAGDVMGCLIEFIEELVLVLMGELIDWIIQGFVKLIVPNKTLSQKTVKRIAHAISAFFWLTIFALLIGVALWTGDGTAADTVGKYMTCISLGVLGSMLLSSILLKILRKRKKK